MTRASRSLLILFAVAGLFGGCNDTTKPKTPTFSYTANDTPTHAVSRLIQGYERRDESTYAAMLTGDFTYEFSNSTDPTLVTQYSTGWFKTDETASSTHLFSGYTPQGGATLPAATSIDINFAIDAPSDDAGSPDPATHKILTTRVDGNITVPQSGAEPLTYVIANNLNVLYLVRGDVATGLQASQPADAQHWYVYHWVDLSEAAAGPSRALAQTSTWGRVRGLYR